MSDETPQVSIIIPTLNEEENIRELIPSVFKACSDMEVEVIVVDDGSIDGTAGVIEELSSQYQLELIKRAGKRGISSAVIEGFNASKGQVLGVMDADMSHPPGKIPQLVWPISKGEAEMTVATRYGPGGGIRGWPDERLLISRSATALARPLTNISDPMSGFFFIRRDLLEGVALSNRGWKICLDILVRAGPEKVEEVSYVFRDRLGGSSKMGASIILDYLLNILDLYIYRLFRSSLRSFVKFCTVGGIGVFLNLAIVYGLVEYLGIDYRASATAAFFLVAANNFVWNKIWTFKDRRSEALVVGRQLVSYLVASLISLSINLMVLGILVEIFDFYYLIAQLLAIAFAVTANFSMNSLWVFGGRD